MTQATHITAEFIWTFDEMKALQEALTRTPVTTKGKSPIYTWLLYSLLAVAIFIMVSGNSTKYRFPSIATIQDNLPTIGAYVLLVLLLWPIFAYAQKHNLRQAFLKNPDYNKRIYVTFTPDEVVMVSEAAETRLKWTKFIEARRTSKGFCFLQTPQSGFWIPLHAFQSTTDAEAVLEMASRLTPKLTSTNAYRVPHNYLNWKCEIQPTIRFKSLVNYETSGKSRALLAHVDVDFCRAGSHNVGMVLENSSSSLL